MRPQFRRRLMLLTMSGLFLGCVVGRGADEESNSGADSDWREESATFIRQYYPNWKEISREDEANHVAFTVTLDELEVESDGLDFARSRELVRDTVLILTPEARERFLMSKHLDAVDYNVLNRWTLPLLGAMSPEERALERERYERYQALLDRNVQVIDFVALQDGAMASRMRTELADAAPTEPPGRDR
jgi:hypothetical protein